jgi:hypothetical protein
VAGHQASLKFRRQLLQKLWRDGRPSYLSDEYIRQRMRCDPNSLKRAAEFFGLNLSIPADVHTLALVLAEEVFGKRKRGRKPGNAAWDADRFLQLAFFYFCEIKVEWPRLNDTKLAEKIAETDGFKEYRNNPELIRQRLPKAKREYSQWCADTLEMISNFPDENYDQRAAEALDIPNFPEGDDGPAPHADHDDL